MEKYKDLGGIHSMDGEKNIDPLSSVPSRQKKCEFEI